MKKQLAALTIGVVIGAGTGGLSLAHAEPDEPPDFYQIETVGDLSFLLTSIERYADLTPKAVYNENSGRTRAVVKVCPEDGVSVGYGEYSADTGWTKYACIPLDDIGAGKGHWWSQDVRRWVREHK